MITVAKLRKAFPSELNDNLHGIADYLEALEKVEEYEALVMEERFAEMSREQLNHHMVRHNHVYMRQGMNPYRIAKRLRHDVKNLGHVNPRPKSLMPTVSTELRHLLNSKLASHEVAASEHLVRREKTSRGFLTVEEMNGGRVIQDKPHMSQEEQSRLTRNIVKSNEESLVADCTLAAAAEDLFGDLKALVRNWAKPFTTGFYPFGDGTPHQLTNGRYGHLGTVLAVPLHVDKAIVEFIKLCQNPQVNTKEVLEDIGLNVSKPAADNTVWVIDGDIRVKIQ